MILAHWNELPFCFILTTNKLVGLSVVATSRSGPKVRTMHKGAHTNAINAKKRNDSRVEHSRLLTLVLALASFLSFRRLIQIASFWQQLSLCCSFTSLSECLMTAPPGPVNSGLILEVPMLSPLDEEDVEARSSSFPRFSSSASSLSSSSNEGGLTKARPEAQPTSSPLHFNKMVTKAHAKNNEPKIMGTADSPSKYARRSSWTDENKSLN